MLFAEFFNSKFTIGAFGTPVGQKACQRWLVHCILPLWDQTLAFTNKTLNTHDGASDHSSNPCGASAPFYLFLTTV